MYILVTYDVNTETKEGQRRLGRVARLCKNYGQRVQNSVFECVLSEEQLAMLKNELEQTMDKVSDSIRIYHLNKNENRRVMSLGKETSIDVEGMLIV